MKTGSCPVTRGFDPFSEAYLVDPYPIFKAVRESAPVSYVPEMDAYLVTRYQDICTVIDDRDTYSSANTTEPVTPLCPEAKAILDTGFPRKPTFTNCDPPRHPRMRDAAMKCLTPRRWEKSQPEIRVYAKELVDELAKKPIADLMDDLAFPLPAFAGFRLLGFPLEDTEKLRGWCTRRVFLTYGKLGKEDQIKAAHDLVDFWDYVRGFVHFRLENPDDDLTSDLLNLSRERGEDLTVEDVINMVYSISLAAHETSTNAILNGLHRILERREEWEAICNDRSLIPNTVEELLRFDSPTLVLRRLTKCDTELAGVPIPAGATLLLALGSAHRDPDYFPDPDTVDISRKNAKRHLAFGRKWHFCLGAPLARFEYNLVLELLSQKTPNMRLISGQEIKYAPTLLIRGPSHLFVEPSPA